MKKDYVFDLATGEIYEESVVSKLFETIGRIGDFRIINMETLFKRMEGDILITEFDMIRQAIIQKTGTAPTLKEIADKIGVAEITVKKWSSGDTVPSTDSLKRLVDAYNLR